MHIYSTTFSKAFLIPEAPTAAEFPTLEVGDSEASFRGRWNDRLRNNPTQRSLYTAPTRKGTRKGAFSSQDPRIDLGKKFLITATFISRYSKGAFLRFHLENLWEAEFRGKGLNNRQRWTSSYWRPNKKYGFFLLYRHLKNGYFYFKNVFFVV